jgi:Mg2+ and Co2+ transporter CorA
MRFNMDEIMETLGILNMIVLPAVFATGLWMKYKRALFYKVHRISGYVAIGMAMVHGILALID